MEFNENKIGIYFYSYNNYTKFSFLFSFSATNVIDFEWELDIINQNILVYYYTNKQEYFNIYSYIMDNGSPLVIANSQPITSSQNHYGRIFCFKLINNMFLFISEINLPIQSYIYDGTNILSNYLSYSYINYTISDIYLKMEGVNVEKTYLLYQNFYSNSTVGNGLMYYTDCLFFNFGSTCILTCPPNVRVDYSLRLCIDCSATIIAPYLFQNNCVGVCPANYGIYNNISCVNCKDYNMQYLNGLCTNITIYANLTLVDNTFNVYKNCSQAGQYYFNNQCLRNCPLGRIVDANNNCLDKCSDGLVLLNQTCYQCINNQVIFNNSCVNTCPDGYTVGQNNTCYLCSKLFNLTYSFNGGCVNSCPDGVQTNPLSCTNCSQIGNYYYVSNKTCVAKCPSNTAIKGSNCTNCKNISQYQYLNKCVATCPENYTSDSSNICQFTTFTSQILDSSSLPSCSPNPCFYGNCSIYLQQTNCTCMQGYFGQLCQFKNSQIPAIAQEASNYVKNIDSSVPLNSSQIGNILSINSFIGQTNSSYQANISNLVYNITGKN